MYGSGSRRAFKRPRSSGVAGYGGARKFLRGRRKAVARRTTFQRVPRTDLITANSAFVKVRYSTFIGTTAAVTTVIYRGNGPNDPDFGVGGGVPGGWATYQTMYLNQCTVFSTCKIEVMNSASASMEVVLFPSLTASLGADPLENNDCYHAVMGPVTAPNGKLTKTMGMSSKKMFGKTSVVDDDVYQSTVISTPTTQYYWVLYLSSPNGADLTDFKCWVTLTYWVKLFNRTQIV